MDLSIHENPTYWVLWLLTAGVCIHQIARSIRSQTGILGFAPIVCTMFGYLYVIQSAGIAATLGNRINPDFLAMGQFVALVSLLAILAGWYKGCGKIAIGPARVLDRNCSQMLWYCGVTTMAIGIFGQYFFYFYFGGTDYTVTAYLYLLFQIAFPGMAICIYLASYDWEYRKASHVLLLIILGALLLLPWAYYVRRGPTFTFLIVVVYSFYLARPRAVNRVVVLGGLGVACITMLFFVFIRSYSGEGSWTAERLQEVNVSNVLLTKALQEGDNEFLYHCCIIPTCVELDRFQWGTSYLSLAMHWIPRQWWPDKPALATGWFEPPTRQDVFDVTGVLPTVGSAYSGVGESFIDFYWLTPVFWFVIGWCFGWLYRHSMVYPMSSWAIVYIGVIAASHYLVTQGFAAFFVPACTYIVVPIAIFALCGAKRGVAAQRSMPSRAVPIRSPVLNRV